MILSFADLKDTDMFVYWASLGNKDERRVTATVVSNVRSGLRALMTEEVRKGAEVAQKTRKPKTAER